MSTFAVDMDKLRDMWPGLDEATEPLRSALARLVWTVDAECPVGEIHGLPDGWHVHPVTAATLGHAPDQCRQCGAEIVECHACQGVPGDEESE